MQVIGKLLDADWKLQTPPESFSRGMEKCGWNQWRFLGWTFAENITFRQWRLHPKVTYLQTLDSIGIHFDGKDRPAICYFHHPILCKVHRVPRMLEQECPRVLEIPQQNVIGLYSNMTNHGQMSLLSWTV
jgi:hypothetical protein